MDDPSYRVAFEFGDATGCRSVGKRVARHPSSLRTNGQAGIFTGRIVSLDVPIVELGIVWRAIGPPPLLTSITLRLSQSFTTEINVAETLNSEPEPATSCSLHELPELRQLRFAPTEPEIKAEVDATALVGTLRSFIGGKTLPHLNVLFERGTTLLQDPEMRSVTFDTLAGTARPPPDAPPSTLVIGGAPKAEVDPANNDSEIDNLED
jgi:hypothetical protein